MNTIKERVLHGLEAVDAGRPLVGLIDQILGDYPDLYSLASQHAAQIVRKHTGKSMDPRFVWWHQFNTSSSSPRTFTGWQHSGPPQKSMVLTELVLERFDLYFQDASDELDQRGGFYLQGPHAMAFDERNEVRMLGSEVQKDLWALDFAVLYREQVERFWLANGEHFSALAKINVLGQGAAARRDGRITALDWQRLHPLISATLTVGQLPTLDQLQQTGNSTLTANRYAFVEGDRGCLYSLHAPDGRVMAYMPWAEESLRGLIRNWQWPAGCGHQLQVPNKLEAFVVSAHSNPGIARSTSWSGCICRALPTAGQIRPGCLPCRCSSARSMAICLPGWPARPLRKCAVTGNCCRTTPVCARRCATATCRRF